MDLLCDGLREALVSFLEASFPRAEHFKGTQSCTGLSVKRLMLLIGIDEGEDRLVDGE